MSSTPLNERDLLDQDQSSISNKKSIYPTFVDLASTFGVLVLAQIAAILLSKIILPLILPSLSVELEQAWLMLITQAIAMPTTIIFIAWMRHRREAPAAPLKFSIKGFNPIIILGGILMILSMSVVIEPLLSLLPAPAPIIARGWPLLVAVVVGAPIFEEIICRGLIMESIRVKRGAFAAWFISSLFFGLIHLDPTMVVNAFFMGLILGYIYLRSESLIAPIIIHSFNNAVAYILIVLGFGENSTLRDLIENQTLYHVLYGVAVAILVISLLLCARQFKKIMKAKQEKEQETSENIIEE